MEPTTLAILVFLYIICGFLLFISMACITIAKKESYIINVSLVTKIVISWPFLLVGTLFLE